MSDWQLILKTESVYRAQMINDLLISAGLYPVLLNQKDTVYGLGNIKVLVKPEEVLRAKKIINDAIKME